MGIIDQLIPVLDLAPDDATQDYLRHEWLLSAFDDVPAVAAQRSAVACRNPYGSGTAVVIERIEVWREGGLLDGRVCIEMGGSDLTTLVTVRARDPRVWSRVSPHPIPHTLIVTYGSNAAVLGGPLHHLRTAAANVKEHFTVPVILTPGTAAYIVDTALNEAFSFNLHWMERPITGQEMQ
jgi:hypothetical protein